MMNHILILMIVHHGHYKVRSHGVSLYPRSQIVFFYFYKREKKWWWGWRWCWWWWWWRWKVERIPMVLKSISVSISKSVHLYRKSKVVNACQTVSWVPPKKNRRVRKISDLETIEDGSEKEKLMKKPYIWKILDCCRCWWWKEERETLGEFERFLIVFDGDDEIETLVYGASIIKMMQSVWLSKYLEKKQQIVSFFIFLF